MPLSQMFADDIRAFRQGKAGLVASAEWTRTIRLADRAARSATPALIESEPGSGAQALARAIHDSSERKGRAFIRLPGDEDPHRAADPVASLRQHLREANGGTLFVPDLKHLSPDAQGKLLEILSLDHAPREGRRTARLDVQIIAASDFALVDAVREKRLREDLYYRFQVLPIALRPLRADPSVIAELAHALMLRFAKDEGKRLRSLTPDAMQLLSAYDWPGNLRQLENAIYRAVILAEGPVLTQAEFPQIAAHLRGARIEIPPVPAMPAPAVAPTSMRVPNDPHALLLMGESGEMRTLAEIEADTIRFALNHYGGQLSAISRRLGIGRSTLYRKLKELGLGDEAA